jgi:hypothetical protein
LEVRPMSDVKEDSTESPFDVNLDDTPEPIDELSSLKARAATMGVPFHPSIGVDKLRAKISAVLKGEPDPDEVAAPPVTEPVVGPSALAVTPAKRTKTKKELTALYHTNLRKEANKLVRIRLTCMNPDKTQWPGEVFDVGNSITGSIKKFVPFEAEDGYHVPFMIYETLVARKYQQHKKVRLPNGAWGIKSGLVREFAVELLNPLGAKGMKELGVRQALNHSID